MGRKHVYFLMILCFLSIVLLGCGSADGRSETVTDEPAVQVESVEETASIEMVENEAEEIDETEEKLIETEELVLESEQISESVEELKVQVQIDIDGIANAYAKVMSEPSMESSDTFGLFDITRDGIPELFSGQGADIITYWSGDRWPLISSMVVLEWYYDEEVGEPVCHYSWGDEQYLNYYHVDSSLDVVFPEEWCSFGEKITENIDVSAYTYIDIHAYDKVSNSSVELMKETLESWLSTQEKYEYIY